MSSRSPKEAGAGASPTASPLLDNTVTNRFATHYKTVQSGRFLEVYNFSKGVLIGGMPKKPSPRRKTEKVVRTEEYKRRTINKAKNRIRRLTQANFDKVGKFLTLTFEDTEKFDIRSLSDCLSRFQNFVKKLRKKYPDVRYIAVPEFQDSNNRGAVHYHLILDLPFVPVEKLHELWGHGFIKINLISTHGAVGAYMAKYLGKYAGDKRFTAHRAYYASRNLLKPIVTYGEHLEEIPKLLESKGVFPDFGSTYASDWNGEIKYSLYNLYQSRKSGNKK